VEKRIMGVELQFKMPIDERVVKVDREEMP